MTAQSPAGPSEGPGPADVIRRLRAWSASSWNHADRMVEARRAGQTLADLAAEREDSPARAVPDHGWSALADQLAVLADDAAAAGVPAAQVAGVFGRLASRLGMAG